MSFRNLLPHSAVEANSVSRFRRDETHAGTTGPLKRQGKDMPSVASITSVTHPWMLGEHKGKGL